MRKASLTTLRGVSLIVTFLGVGVHLSQCMSERSNLFGSIHTECLSPSDCFHGYCNAGRCACVTGWTGVHCEDRVFPFSKTSIQFVGHTKRTDVESDVYVNKNVIISNHKKVSRLLNSLFKEDKSSSYDDHRQSDGLMYTSSHDDSSDHEACSSSYKPRPLKQRLCTAGLACQYGTCDLKNTGTALIFTCVCDPGASGLLCQKRCCLDCGNNGRCEVFANGTKFCNCRLGYSGESCDQRVSLFRYIHGIHGSDNLLSVYLKFIDAVFRNLVLKST